MKKYKLFFLAPLALSACATEQASLTLYSNPGGAYITDQRGQHIGFAPAVVYFNSANLKKFRNEAGCYLVVGFKAEWVSGAKQQTGETLPMCGSEDGEFTFHMNRDMNAPGLEKDLEFALKMQTLQAQQQQSKAAKDAAAFQLMNLYRVPDAGKPTSK